MAVNQGQSYRLAEVVASLSLATDLGIGQPTEHALRACLLAMRLAERLGLSEQDRADLYYVALLRSTGCTATAHQLAAAVGDEIAFYTQFASVNYVLPNDLFGPLVRYLGQLQPWTRRAKTLASFVAAMPRMNPQDRITSHCEVAQQMAQRLGFDQRMGELLFQTFERWDGRGMPRGLKGEAIDRVVRIVHLAEDATGFHRLGGVDAAVTMIRRGQGKAHDPALVAAFCQDAAVLVAGFDAPSLWEVSLDAEPTPWRRLSAADLETAARAIADFADLKSPYLVDHSTGVAELAAAAAQRCGLPESDVRATRQAGLLHDLGRTAIPNNIWDKAGPLTNGEWERVRLHPYYTERILARASPFATLGALASLHHERLDGSGYHRGLPGTLQPLTARLLAAADVYHAMTEPRPHRARRSLDEAASTTRAEANAGRLDPEAVDAVLAAAGHASQPTRRVWPAKLTDREVDVLRLIARGATTRAIAQALVIADKTADHHIQHIYNKIGVSTRAGATFFAMQHGLVGDDGSASK
jgi:HD-GYP domain-containing protein (c-di-GMP phosphodiesterase class II)